MQEERDSTHQQAVLLITGISASGKSTVAQKLAERLPCSVHVRGDLFRRLIVNGRADMTPSMQQQAVDQLRLRYRLTANVTDTYFEAGYTVVVQDVILGEHLAELAAAIRSRPLLVVVVLTPRIEVVKAREATRTKTGYGFWTVGQLDRGLREQTPHLGLWLDNSDQTPSETVDEILKRAWTEAVLP